MRNTGSALMVPTHMAWLVVSSIGAALGEVTAHGPWCDDNGIPAPTTDAELRPTIFTGELHTIAHPQPDDEPWWTGTHRPLTPGESEAWRLGGRVWDSSGDTTQPIATGVPSAAGDMLSRLHAAIVRLRANPCPTMAFGFEPDDIARAVESELDELRAHAAWTPGARREAAGLVAVSLHALIVNGGGPADLEREVERLTARLDRMAAGLTWAAAKALETDQ